MRLVVWSMGFSCELLCCVDAQQCVVRSGTRRLLTARWVLIARSLIDTALQQSVDAAKYTVRDKSKYILRSPILRFIL